MYIFGMVASLAKNSIDMFDDRKEIWNHFDVIDHYLTWLDINLGGAKKYLCFR